ncbi:MAG: 6-phosphofructokinase [Burkholderiales bacterium]|nr:6-phosphofructokinase [Burkholderiales bacterium]
MIENKPKNAIYAQSGGVTAVINASAAGVITAFRAQNEHIANLYAAQNGILGVLHEQLVNTNLISNEQLLKLRQTPGGIFKSCRYKLKNLLENRKEYERLIEVFSAYNIEYFFYNGGNDSADTCIKVAQIAAELNYPIKAIHIPKTIDNDLVITDNCPGFGSVAKYIATSIKEAGYDLASMALTSTKVFILEVMGRHAGWIAASGGLAANNANEAPHIILFPEVAFDEQLFLAKVQQVVATVGYCVVIAAEGVKDKNGKSISAAENSKDAFGHAQLGGVASVLAKMVGDKLGLKYHYAIADYLQRSARHIASKTDVEQAYCLGYAAINYALQGKNAIMPYIKRVSQQPYLWEIDYAPLSQIANQEKTMPLNYIAEDGFHITPICREYLQPLILGEDYPSYSAGLPDYLTLELAIESKKLPPFSK